MADLSTGRKTKITISPCTVEDNGDIKVNKSKQAFEAMLNPASYSHSHSISYNRKKALGELGSDLKFDAVKPEAVSFDLVIDGSGVINSPADVKSQIKQLEDVVYKYEGSEHQPNHVRLLWGSLIFFGRLESMSVEYTLFKPSGEPLRAKIKLAFAGFMSKQEESRRANRSSPDLFHIVEVKAGDTLPLLCYRIYKDSAYYLSVARANSLVNFRSITPGMRLWFPPLK